MQGALPHCHLVSITRFAELENQTCSKYFSKDQNRQITFIRWVPLPVPLQGKEGTKEFLLLTFVNVNSQMQI